MLVKDAPARLLRPAKQVLQTEPLFVPRAGMRGIVVRPGRREFRLQQSLKLPECLRRAGLDEARTPDGSELSNNLSVTPKAEVSPGLNVDVVTDGTNRSVHQQRIHNRRVIAPRHNDGVRRVGC